MKSSTIIGTAFLMMLSVDAQAQTSTDPAATPANATAPASDQDKNNPIICRLERVGGALAPTRICHTRNQWNDLSRQSQDMLRGVQRSTGFNNNSTVGG